MAYRQPLFLSHHALRLAGAAAIGGTAMHVDFPVARAFDSAGLRRARFGGTAANQYVKVDRGAGFAALQTLDRLIIPAGHNLNGCTVQVRQHTSDPAAGTDGTLIGSQAVTGSALVEIALSPALSNRYAIVNFVTAGTAWEFGELWLGKLNALTTSSPEPEWTEAPLARIAETELESGAVFRVARGQTKRTYRLRIPWNAAADVAVFDFLLSDTADGLFPFYFYDMDSTHAAVRVELVGGLPRRQDHPVPSSSTTFAFELELREAVT